MTTFQLKRTINFVANGNRCRIEVETRPAHATDGSLTVDLLPIPPDALTLSITGETGGAAGQCTDSVREAGEGCPDVLRLCDIWERWHLNDLKAGTRAQMNAFADLDPIANATYEGRKAALAAVGLEPDRNTAPDLAPYSFGSAWLYEPLPDGLLAELALILERLDGARLGDVPDVDDAPELKDPLDSRDVIARLEIYKSAVLAMGVDADSVNTADAWPEHIEPGGDDAEVIEEFISLRDLDSYCDGYAPDWQFGVTLIPADEFEQYAQELAEDCGMVNKDATWPNNCINWSDAAEELRQDYTEVAFQGRTYLFR